MIAEIEAIYGSDKPPEEKSKAIDQVLANTIDELDDRQRSLLRTKAEENWVADTVSIYDFWTEEDFERNPIP